MLIFIDTSFLIAEFNRNNQWHPQTHKIIPLINKEDKLTSTFVMSETLTHIGSIGGGKKAVLLHDYIIDTHELIYMDKNLHYNAMDKFLMYDGTLSFADVVSLEIMETQGIDTIVSFDSDFDKVQGIKRIH